jgi:hypothetical protein
VIRLVLALACALALAGCQTGTAPHPGEHAFTGKAVLVLLQDKAHPSTRAGRSLWALERPLTYRVRPGETITVPAGFVTDLASVPRPLWVLYPPDGPWAQAAIVHDYEYKTLGSGVWNGHRGNSRPAPYTRAEADSILRQAMADLGIPEADRDIIFAGVRAGGAPGWGR